MNELSPQRVAGEVLRNLISERYPTQEDFSLEFGADIRTISRYINNGINKLDIIQQLAEYFKVDFTFFFTLPS